MFHHDHDDDERYVIVEKRSNDVGSFLLGAAIGVGVALLLAPRSGAETRRDIRRRVRRVRRSAEQVVTGVADSVTDTIQEARQRVEDKIDSARQAVDLKKRQVRRAVDAGRAAADEARFELEQRIAHSKATLREEGSARMEDGARS